MRARLAEIRAKLDRLRALDTGCIAFGAGGWHGHQYRELPRLAPTDVAALEAKLGVALPDELAGFLQYVHGGGPGPGYRFSVTPDAQGPLAKTARPFPYDNAQAAELVERRKLERYASLPLTDDDAEDDDWPPGPGFISIAELGCGVTDVIVVSGEQRGTVWCCDMAWRPHECGFLDWYEHWLDFNLQPGALERQRGC